MEDKTQSLLVRNLSPMTSIEDLKQNYTKRPRGFAFVEFPTYEDAVDSLKIMNHTIIDKQEVDIIIAQERRKSPATMRRLCEMGKYGGRRRSNSPRGYRRRSPSPYGRRNSGSPPPHRYRSRSRSFSRSQSRGYRRERVSRRGRSESPEYSRQDMRGRR
eukprot:Platyproteum_vivax@DN5486_c0_g1_i1.p1